MTLVLYHTKVRGGEMKNLSLPPLPYIRNYSILRKNEPLTATHFQSLFIKLHSHGNQFLKTTNP